MAVNYKDAVDKKTMKESQLAERLFQASDEDIREHVARILQDDQSEYASFLIKIKDAVVKEGKADIWKQLLEIKDKVKDKTLLTQQEVDLLQSYDLKCRRGMNIQGRTFSTLDGCDFSGANIDYIIVNGHIKKCSLGATDSSINIYGVQGINVKGGMIGNKISGVMIGNIVTGDMFNNTVSGNIFNNTVSGDICGNTFGGNMNDNTVTKNRNMFDNTVAGNMNSNIVSGYMYSNTVSGNMNSNIVSGYINYNKVAGDILTNTYSIATNNRYGGTTDIDKKENTKLTTQERQELFGK